MSKKPFSALLAWALALAMILTFTPLLAQPTLATEGDYNADDIAAINSLIDNNGLDWPSAPDTGATVDQSFMMDWQGVTWEDDASSNLHILYLFIDQNNLTGSVDLSRLTALQVLDCSYNSITSLDLSGCTELAALECGHNPLTHLKLSGGYELNVNSVPTQGGSVLLTAYDHDTKTATLQATAASGYSFSSWTCSPESSASGNTFTLLPNTTVTVAARFTADGPTSTTVTVTPPEDITYGAALGDPSAVADAGGNTFTFSYTGTLGDATTYGPSEEKPTDPGQYTVTATLDSETYAGSGSADFTIEQKTLAWNGNGTVVSKPYNGTTAATVAVSPTLNGLVDGDTVAISAGTVVFSSASVGTNINVTATGFGMDVTSSDAWKYHAPSSQPLFAAGTITPAALTITSATITGKTFDNSVSATVIGVTFNGLASGETLTLGTDYSVTGEFNSATAGSGKTVAIPVTLLSTARTANYELPDDMYYLTGQSISQADAPLILTQEIDIPAGTATSGNEVDIAALLPLDRGTTTFTIYSADIPPFTSGTNVSSAGLLTFSTDASASANDLKSIVVTATMENYQEVSVEIEATFVEPTLPIITIDPATPASTATVTFGSISGSLSVSASVTESATVSYQWYANGTDSNAGGTSLGADNGANTATYTIPTTLAAGTYYYYCVVSATGGATPVASSVAMVTVDKADQAPLAISGLAGPYAYGGGPLMLGTTGGTTSGAVTYTASNTNVATVSGNAVHLVGTGSFTITAVMAGNTNYNEVRVTSNPITVNKGTYSGTTTASKNISSNTAATGLTVTLPTLPVGAAYGASGAVGGATPALIASHSIAGRTLTIAVTAQPNGTTATITIPVTGATNYNDYTVVVTIAAADTSPAGLGGGGGGGGAAPSSTLPAADGMVTVNYSQSGGAVTLNLPGSKVTEIINKSKNGQATFDLSKISGATDIAFPTTAFTQLSKAGLAVEIKLPQGTLTLSADAAKSVAEQASGANLGIGIKQLQASNLNAAQRSAVKDSDMIVDINLYSGAQKITNLNGYLTVTLPYSGLLPDAVWYLNDTGTLEKLASSYDQATKTVTFTINHLSIYVVGEDLTPIPLAPQPSTPALPVNPFTDVYGSDWFIDAVMYAYSSGLMNGTSTDPMLFSPSVSLTRAMIVTILYRQAGEPEVSGLDNPFADVAEGQWYSKAVKWAAANEIALGYGNALFGTNDSVTKEQLAVLIYRTQQSTGKIPPDILADYEHPDWNKISDWAKSAVNRLTMQGVFRDLPGTAFNPQDPATRAETASMLYRYLTAVE